MAAAANLKKSQQVLARRVQGVTVNRRGWVELVPWVAAVARLPTSLPGIRVPRVLRDGRVVAVQFMLPTSPMDPPVLEEVALGVAIPTGMGLTLHRRRLVAAVDRLVPEATQHPDRGVMVVLEPRATSLEWRLPTVAVAVAVSASLVGRLDPEATEVETAASRQLGVMANSVVVAAAQATTTSVEKGAMVLSSFATR